MAELLSRADLVDSALDWPVRSTQVLAEGYVADFVRDEVVAPDGDTMRREYLRHPGAVGVIAMDDKERIALVRQYRHPVRQRLIEPPAGLLDVAGEDLVLAAQRELAEEVGLAAGRWDRLVDLYTTPGINDERLIIFLARDLSEVAAPDGFVRHGEEAHMDTVWAALSDVVDAVLAGDVHNPTVVAGALAAWAAKGRGWSGLRSA